MPAYSAIADSEIDPESPGTSTLFTKLRDNPLSIAEGDSTAPQIIGNRRLLYTLTAAVSTSIIFDEQIDSTYSSYEIRIDDLLAASAASLRVRVSTDAGSTWKATGYLSHTQTRQAGFTTYAGAASTTDIQASAVLSASALSTLSGWIRIYSPSSTTVATRVSVDTIQGLGSSANGGGSYGAANAVDAIQLIMSTGNITSGTFKLYGIA